MKKIVIWILGLAVGLLVLLAAAVIIVPSFIDVKSYLPAIEKKITQATGRSIDLGGDVEVSVFPWAGVSFSKLTMANPEKFGGGPFVKVESFEAQVKILPLLSRKIVIDRFVLVDPEIELVRLADGSVNWTFTPPDSGSQPRAEQKPAPEAGGDGGGAKDGSLELAALEVGEFAVTGGRIVYRDEALGQTRTIDDITFKLEDVSLERPIGVVFRANVDDRPVQIDGTVGPIGREPGKGTVAIDLNIDAFRQLAMHIKGELIEPASEQKFDLQLGIEEFSPRQLLAELDIPLPVETADDQALGALAVDLKVAGSPRQIAVKQSTVRLDQSTLTVDAAISEMDKPKVAFSLGLDAIDLDRYLPPPRKEGQGESGAAAGQEKSGSPPPSGSSGGAGDAGGAAAKTPAADGGQPPAIDYEPLRRLVLDGKVQVGELIASGARVTNVAVQVRGRDGVFNLDPARLDLYQGALSVVGKVDVRKADPEGQVKLDADGIMVGGLVRDSIGKEIIEGTMAAQADIAFNGDTAAEIKKSLNGTGDLRFLDGALVGIDIAGMARDLAAGLGKPQPAEKPRTDFAELRVPFTLTDGRFQTDGTFLKSPLLRVEAVGSADLVAETLDMKVRPKLVGTLKGQGDTEQRSGVTVPIHVGGTFARPEYTADLSGIATRETLEEAIKDPESAKKKVKELEKTGKELEEVGKGLLKGLGFGKD